MRGKDGEAGSSWLVLVGSGGLGREVHPLLRAATLPGAELVLPLIAHERVLSAGIFAGRLLNRIGLKAAPDLAEMARGYASLGDGEHRPHRVTDQLVELAGLLSCLRSLAGLDRLCRHVCIVSRLRMWSITRVAAR